MGGELRGEFGGLRGEAERGLLHERAQHLFRASLCIAVEARAH